jgi:hypothetical protein
VVKKAVAHGAVWASTFVGVFLLVGFCFYKFGPTLQLALFPPLSDVTATVVKVSEDHTDILLTATKAQTCQTVSISAVSYVNNQPIVAKINMLQADGSVLPIDKQRVSVGAKFVRLVRVTPASSRIEAYGEYRCHNFWTVNMKVFEVDLSKNPAQVR